MNLNFPNIEFDPIKLGTSDFYANGVDLSFYTSNIMSSSSIL